MQNNTLINQINIMINEEQKDSSYKFPNVNARYMIDFERAYNNNYHNPVLVFVRQDIKDFNNNRTYYLYEKDNKIYEVQVIVDNEIVSTYTKPHNNKLQIPTVN
jgi:hypothetical protein